MTDNEIIKALGCCPYQRDCVSCDVNACDNSPNYIMKNARDLINRQKAEIERLEDVNIRLTKAEAIKDFAYRLKQIPNKSVSKREIDEMVKEMVGDASG